MVWEHISTWKNFGERNKVISWTSSSESEPGNTDNFPSSVESTILQDPTKPVNLASKPNKAMLSTDAESEEVEEKDPFLKVSSQESPLQSVSINSSQPVTFVQRPKSVLVELSEVWEFSTAIGLLKTEPTNITRLSVLTPTMLPLETMLELTGLLILTKSTEN